MNTAKGEQKRAMEYSADSIVSLISHIHAATAKFANKMLSHKCGFISSHGFILYQLSLNETLTMGEIAKRINRRKSTATVLIRKLCEEGLVRIQHSGQDSRQKLISLTEKGKEYNSFTAGISRELLSVCYKGFSKKEKEALLELLLKMNKNIESAL